MEPIEMPEFSSKMKESAEASEQGASLTNISLAISILAVMVAMVTVLGHRSHTEAILAQSRAGDQWSEYQTKRIRSDQAEVAVELLTLQPSADAAATAKKLAEYRAHQAKWQNDLDQEKKEAQQFEAGVDHAEGQASRFDLGEALLQIGVVLCSITLFTRRKLYFYLGIAIGASGTIVACSAWLVH